MCIGYYSEIITKAADSVRGLVKLIFFSKNPRKTRIGQTTPTHLLPIFFRNLWKHENNTKIHNKITKFDLGLNPPTHFRVFLGFLDFYSPPVARVCWESCRLCLIGTGYTVLCVVWELVQWLV